MTWWPTEQALGPTTSPLLLSRSSGVASSLLVPFTLVECSSTLFFKCWEITAWMASLPSSSVSDSEHLAKTDCLLVVAKRVAWYPLGQLKFNVRFSCSTSFTFYAPVHCWCYSGRMLLTIAIYKLNVASVMVYSFSLKTCLKPFRITRSLLRQCATLLTNDSDAVAVENAFGHATVETLICCLIWMCECFSGRRFCSLSIYTQDNINWLPFIVALFRLCRWFDFLVTLSGFNRFGSVSVPNCIYIRLCWTHGLFHFQKYFFVVSWMSFLFLQEHLSF